jgi:hypothetical protein
MAIKRGRGRPPVYANLINGIRVNDGWVDVCPQQNRTAPSGYRSRYPENEFRVVPNPEGGDKPYVLQSRRLRKAEKDARAAAQEPVLESVS